MHFISHPQHTNTHTHTQCQPPTHRDTLIAHTRVRRVHTLQRQNPLENQSPGGIGAILTIHAYMLKEMGYMQIYKHTENLSSNRFAVHHNSGMHKCTHRLCNTSFGTVHQITICASNPAHRDMLHRHAHRSSHTLRLSSPDMGAFLHACGGRSITATPSPSSVERSSSASTSCRALL